MTTHIASREGETVRGAFVRATLAAVLLLAPLLSAPDAAAGQQPAPEIAAPLEAATVSTPGWTPPLSTRGRWIVDANGDRFKLRSGNWHGASGTWNGSGSADDDAHHHAGENSGRIPLGLDRAPMAEIIAGFREIGINSIRLPFSNEMIHDGRPVTDAAVAANPALRGRTPLQVYDVVVRELTDAGLAVILNNHTNTTRWCCGIDGNERWNASRSTGTWEDDWLLQRGAPLRLGRPQLGARRQPRLVRRLAACRRPHPDGGRSGSADHRRGHQLDRHPH
jgi:hypothetical protein